MKNKDGIARPKKRFAGEKRRKAKECFGAAGEEGGYWRRRVGGEVAERRDRESERKNEEEGLSEGKRG